jgi:hypothetical protein
MGIAQNYFKKELELKTLGTITEEECIIELIDSHKFLRARNIQFTKFLHILKSKWYLRWALRYLPIIRS